MVGVSRYLCYGRGKCSGKKVSRTIDDRTKDVVPIWQNMGSVLSPVTQKKLKIPKDVTAYLCMLTIESRRFPVLGEVSFLTCTLHNC